MVFTKKITNITLVVSFKNFKNKIIFVILIKIGNGCGDFSPIRESGWERGNGNGDRLNYVLIPVPERGLIFLPVPVPFGNGDFPPLRGGAPAGTGIPQLFAIPKCISYKMC